MKREDGLDISASEFTWRLKRALTAPFRKLVTGGTVGGFCKQNLSPMLGRRDAVVQAFFKAFNTDVMSLTAPERLAVYRKWCGLLEEGISGTERIISALSGQDSTMREQRLLNLLEFFQEGVLSAGEAAVSEIRFFEGDFAVGCMVPQEAMSKLRRRHNAIVGIEAEVINGLHDMLNLTRDSVRRHQEYACKSASSHNLARYRSAYAAFAAGRETAEI